MAGGLKALAKSLNPEDSLLATTFLALLVAMLSIGSIAVGGVQEPVTLAILFLAILGIFVYIGWMGLMVYVAACILTFSIALLTRAVIN